MTMTPEMVMTIAKQALELVLLMTGVILLPALAVGLLVSMFQAATQINEMTLVFIPKMLAVGLALLIFFPWMLQLMIDFTQNVFSNIPVFAR